MVKGMKALVKGVKGAKSPEISLESKMVKGVKGAAWVAYARTCAHMRAPAHPRTCARSRVPSFFPFIPLTVLTRKDRAMKLRGFFGEGFGYDSVKGKG